MAKEVAIVANFMMNKGPVEAGAGDRQETVLDPKMRRRQFVRERNLQSYGDLAEPLLCLPMSLDEVVTQGAHFGGLRAPFGNPAHILLLDFDLDRPGKKGAIRIALAGLAHFPEAQRR